MNCNRTDELLHPYLDGELDLMTSLDVERHLEGCEACAAAHTGNLSVRASLNEPGQYFRAPESLRRRIRAAVKPAPRTPAAMRWLAVAACLAAAFVAVWQYERPGRALEAEILSSHVRSLMPGHLTDVISGDSHTVKPWFAGRLDFSPLVVDLASSGFPLAGGRLDYVGGRPVAALVYKRRQHVINVFVWPSGGDSGIRTSARRGFNSLRWSRSGMEYWAISDLNGAELKQFAELLRGG